VNVGRCWTLLEAPTTHVYMGPRLSTTEIASLRKRARREADTLSIVLTHDDLEDVINAAVRMAAEDRNWRQECSFASWCWHKVPFATRDHVAHRAHEVSVHDLGDGFGWLANIDESYANAI
jgi:hypothetical protein